MAKLQDRQITLDGVTYSLRYSVKATIALQEAWGAESIQAAEGRLAEAMKPGAAVDIADFVTIIWAGMRTHHPEMTPEQVLDLLDDGGLEGLERNMREAVEAGSAPAPDPHPGHGRAARRPSR